MTEIAFIILALLIGLVVGQAVLVSGFVIRLLRAARRPADYKHCPKAAVILCLRGTDPFLPDCIEALLHLDYPCYDVKIVVDSPQDPAWRVAEDVVARGNATNVEIQALTQRRATCSLKCSSLVQAISRLDPSYEVVAQLDADTIAHPGWLSELLAPLADDKVGAATGNRWYMPQDASWGSLIRYVWNAAAVVQMFWYRIAWGGTLAVKTEVFRQSDLLERWGNAFCEDTMLYKALRKQGLRLAFVPSLMMVNREACDIGGYFQWVRRQLLTARLYHPGWAAVMGHALITTLVPILAIGTLAVALGTQQWTAAVWVGVGLVGYQVAIALVLAPLEFAVRRIVAARNEPTNWISSAIAVKYLPALILTQFVYPAALASALLIRSVGWRGVSYRIEGPWRIHLIEYRPYVSEDSGDRTSHSL